MLAQVEGREDSAAISMAMLRSLAHAEYSPNNIGHFGLALEAYAHFTSPIRRYPDLLVHRAIRHIIRGGKPGAVSTMTNRKWSALVRSRRHTNDGQKMQLAMWRPGSSASTCSKHIGNDYPGVITGVTNFGVFVQIPELLIDGLVHVTSLQNDYYHHDPSRMRLVGERTGRSYQLGDAMHVQVQRVDMETRRIDFTPFDPDGGERKRGRRR